MLVLAFLFSCLSLILGFGFYRKYQARLRLEPSNALRYSRIGDYYGRPIPLAFAYRFENSEAASLVEVDVEEIYHYGRDYFLKGHSPDRKRCQIYKWSRISRPRVRLDGRSVESLEQLLLASDGRDSRAAA